jgi:hypothetical protein
VTQILIVANQTVCDERLVAEVLRRATEDPDSEFFIVVPTTPLSKQEQALRHSEHPLQFGESGPVTLARRRLREALRLLAPTAVKVSGDIGDANPLKAVTAAMAARQVDEIIVSTLPRQQSRWLAADLPTRLHRKTGLPVVHVETGTYLKAVRHDGAPAAVASQRNDG